MLPECITTRIFIYELRWLAELALNGIIKVDVLRRGGEASIRLRFLVLYCCCQRHRNWTTPNMEELSNDALQTLLAHIRTAVASSGVPVATLVEMLAQLPASIRGPFAATRETIQLVVGCFPSALFIDAYDKIHLCSKDCGASTGESRKYMLSANRKMNTITHFRDVKGRMTKVMNSYGFAMMERRLKSLVFVPKMFVEHGRRDDSDLPHLERQPLKSLQVLVLPTAHLDCWQHVLTCLEHCNRWHAPADKTMEWLSAAVGDRLKGIVYEQLREALQKLWFNAE
ncbi:hypothetical protein MTO96_020587 [Rhipicephalus appendiculatus]